MEKLRVSDVQILNCGQQLRNEIIAVYGDQSLRPDDMLEQAIGDFAVNIQMTPITVANALNTCEISVNFKLRIVEDLGRSYSDIVKTEKEQAHAYAEQILNSKELYKDIEDIETLEKAKKLCIKNNLLTEAAYLFKMIAHVYATNNQVELALQNMKMAVNMVEDQGNSNFSIDCCTELGKLYYYNADIEKALYYYNYANTLLELNNRADRRIKALNFYRLGICYLDKNDLQSARTHFYKSRQYFTAPIDLGDVSLNIANSYTKEKYFKKALKYYDKALEFYGKDDIINLVAVLNNKADLYKSVGELEKALELIMAALENARLVSPAKEIISFLTYAEIKALMGSCDFVEKLLGYIRTIPGIYIFKPIVLTGLNAIIGAAHKNDECMSQLSEGLLDIIREINDSSEYVKGLKELYCDTVLHLRKI